jgi:hypothetical protein
VNLESLIQIQNVCQTSRGKKKGCGVETAGSEEVQWQIFVTAKLHPLYYHEKCG